MVRKRPALGLLLATWAQIARAEPPVIDHVAVTDADPGHEVVLRGTIRCPGGVTDARVFFRRDAGAYEQIGIKPASDGAFLVSVPAPPGARVLEYFLTANATKGLEEARWMSREHPQSVVIRRPAETAPAASAGEPSMVVAETRQLPGSPGGVALMPPPPKAPRLRSLAIYDLQAKGVDERTAAVVTEAMIGELRKMSGHSVLGMGEVRAMLALEAQKQLLGCEDDSCLTELAGAIGVDELVIGSLGRVGESHVFSAKRIDMQQAKTLQSVTKRVPVVDGQEFLSLVEPVVHELFPAVPLLAGLARGVNPEMVHLLNPPPLPRWVFFGTAAIGAGLAVGGVGIIASSSADKAEFDRLTATGTITSEDRTRLQGAMDSKYGTGNALLLSSGISIAFLVVEALFTDWYGYRAWKAGQKFDP